MNPDDQIINQAISLAADAIKALTATAGGRREEASTTLKRAASLLVLSTSAEDIVTVSYSPEEARSLLERVDNDLRSVERFNPNERARYLANPYFRAGDRLREALGEAVVETT